MKLKSVSWFNRQFNRIMRRRAKLQALHRIVQPVLTIVDQETGEFDAVGFNPNGKLVRVNPSGSRRLTVRESFAALRQIKRKTCREWVDAQIDNAAELRWLGIAERHSRRLRRAGATA